VTDARRAAHDLDAVEEEADRLVTAASRRIHSRVRAFVRHFGEVNQVLRLHLPSPACVGFLSAAATPSAGAQRAARGREMRGEGGEVRAAHVEGPQAKALRWERW
jgi:hypothetical protein